MEKVLVVGKNSFIGKYLNNCDKVSYKNFKDIDLKQYDVVVNCALNPQFKTSKYKQSIDVDFEIGKKACESNCHYVMISTSKIYGNETQLKVYDELCEVNPFDYYSENKLKSEIKLLANYAENTTILRGSNIFGFEYGRNSFVGYCMTSLVNEGIIKYNISSENKRDFLFVKDAADLIEKVCVKRPLGVYNLSSNYPLTIKTVANKLIEGYPYEGKFICDTDVLDRQFVLDNKKLQNALNIKINNFDFDNIFIELGKQLCKI